MIVGVYHPSHSLFCVIMKPMRVFELYVAVIIVINVAVVIISIVIIIINVAIYNRNQ